MADQNASKIAVQAQVRPGPNATETQQPTAPATGSAPTVDGTLHPHSLHRTNPDAAGTLATSDVAQIANPFVEVATPAPLETELRDLAAQDSGVQLRETHQVHLGAPTPMPYASQPGPSDWQANLASIGMAVWVTRTVGATDVPVSEASPTLTGLPPTQTVTTHQDMKRVVVSVLDDSLLARQPGEPHDDNLDEINMDFAEELLKDDGEETIEYMVRTYNQRIEAPQRTQGPPSVGTSGYQFIPPSYRATHLSAGISPRETTQHPFRQREARSL